MAYNYNNVGKTDKKLVAHYAGEDCSYVKRKLAEFKERYANILAGSKLTSKDEKKVVASHIAAATYVLDNLPSSCSIMGGRSKRTRRAKKSKRAKRTRRNH